MILLVMQTFLSRGKSRKGQLRLAMLFKEASNKSRASDRKYQRRNELEGCNTPFFFTYVFILYAITPIEPDVVVQQGIMGSDIKLHVYFSRHTLQRLFFSLKLRKKYNSIQVRE